jgi:CBS domain-containing protein
MAIDPTLLSKFTIGPGASIEDAMRKIENNDHGTLIVLGERGQVVGTLTDGDVRKSLLDHRLLMIPVAEVMNTHFMSVNIGENDRAVSLFEQHFHLRLLPVVDRDGMLFDILRREQV